MTNERETPPALPGLLTIGQTAEALAVCERTVWLMTRRGDLPAVKIGRAVRYDPADVRAFIERQKQETNT